MADDGGAEGIVAVVAGKAEQLSDTGLDIGELFAELFFQFVDFRRCGEPILEIQFVDQGEIAAGRDGSRSGLFQRLEHLIDETALYRSRLARKFVYCGHQAAVLCDSACLDRGRVQFFADQSHDLVVDLLQGLGKQGGAGFAQLRIGGRGGLDAEFLPVPGHAQFLQRAQRLGRLAHERDADAERAQTPELGRHAESARIVGGGRGEDDFDFGVGALGQRGDGRFRIGEAKKEAAEAEVADFAGDFGVAGLGDDGRLRDLEAPVAP